MTFLKQCQKLAVTCILKPITFLRNKVISRKLKLFLINNFLHSARDS